MTVSWPFFIVLAVIVLRLRGYKNIFLYGAAATSSFSATAAVNFSSAGVALSWCMIIFAIADESALFALRNFSSRFQTLNRHVYKLLAIYWLFVLIGLMRLGIFGPAASSIQNGFVFQNPGLDMTNLARFAFFTLGLCFVVLFSCLSSQQQVKNVLFYYICGVLVAGIIGVVDHFVTQDALAGIFNTNVSKFAQGYTAENKIAGPAVESSILVQNLGIALAMVFPIFLMQDGIGRDTKKISYFVFFVLIVILLISGAHSTLLVMSGIVLQSFILIKSRKIKILFFALILALSIPFALTLGVKLASYSGFERYWSVYLSFLAFLEHPLLGYGFAEVTSMDLVVNMLANTGIIATASFVAILFLLFRFYRKFKARYGNDLVVNVSFGALINLLVVNCFTGYAHPFTHFYIVLAAVVWTYRQHYGELADRLGTCEQKNLAPPV